MHTKFTCVCYIHCICTPFFIYKMMAYGDVFVIIINARRHAATLDIFINK